MKTIHAGVGEHHASATLKAGTSSALDLWDGLAHKAYEICELYALQRLVRYAVGNSGAAAHAKRIIIPQSTVWKPQQLFLSKTARKKDVVDLRGHFQFSASNNINQEIPRWSNVRSLPIADTGPRLY